ncbi:MAG: CvpA family protein [Taibaiella sp.]|nr:CvpA family protein [Taibaiella sp.]
MALDITGLVIILLFFIRGYMKGLIVAAFSVIGILLGILVALKMSQSFAAWLLANEYITSGWAQVISYMVLFVGVVLLVRLVAKVVEKAVEGVMLGIVNKLAGALLYAFLGAVIWSSLLWIGARVHVLSAETIATSHTYYWLSLLAPWFCEQAGKLLPFVQDTFIKLEHFFETVNQPATDVGTH